ncbi:hypothetical protein SteCoe_27298 [Stentor coeruleus]|uniref:Uncharacterized protein n=1 Tax=Stentor coeruleus TaxID=5963 RepID=A0A1R2BAY8_9CILI|nr:hypothetical protein SteCoe_27298 [Stentor coeruleus]
MKILSKQSGYTKRYKKPSNQVDLQKPLLPKLPRTVKSPIKAKLPPLSQENKKSHSATPGKSLFKKNLITNIIEEKSNDYEDAIKAHLGIKNLSPDSSLNDFSPKPKPRILLKPIKIAKSIDYSFDNDLAAIELEESKLTDSIKNLDKNKKKSIKTKNPSVQKIANAEDKEIKIIQDSLNKINSLLNKILNKSPNKPK